MLSEGDTCRKTSHFSFIFERLFSTQLASERSISYTAYRYSRAELHERYPACYIDFLADLQDLEERLPDDPEPVQHSRHHQRFLQRQNQEVRWMNRPWIGQRLNRLWQRWERSPIRNAIMQK